jgi:hypothetical protein
VAAAIIEDVQTSMGLRGAAMRQGFSQQLVQNWVTRGNQLWESGRDWDELDEIEKLYVFFALEVNRARGECEREAVDNFKRDALAARDWRAWAWFLERAFPEDWGPPHKQVRVQFDGRVQVERTAPDLADRMTTVDRVQQLQELARKLSPAEGQSRPAAIQDDQPERAEAAPDATAAELSEDELLALGKRMCASGECVGRRGRLFTCIGCGVTKSRALPAIEEIAA